MAGIYYHIPFCKRICSYCDFYRTAQISRLPQLIEAMCREIEQRRDYLQGEPIRTRYFGGGTPSLCTIEQLKSLLDTTARHFDCTELEESTLEANPDDLNPQYLNDLRTIGIDRLSIGIQSFDDGCLRLMNRRHTASQAIRAVKDAQAAGFDNLTIDLIFGVPGYGGAAWERSIDQALELGVQHISAYLLTIEPRTRFGVMAAKGELTEVADTVCEEEFMRLHERLSEAGFDHYEISNYALPGYRARHNGNYWQGIPYLGIGPAAHSFDGDSRQWNVASVEGYLAGQTPKQETLTIQNRIDEYIMTRLRTVEGLSLSDFEARFGLGERQRLEADARQEMAAERLIQTDERLSIPIEHLLVSDSIISSLFVD